MKLIDYRKELINSLYEACSKDVIRLSEDLSSDTVFSYAIYCDSGLASFGGAAGSRKGIESHVGKDGDDAYLYAETYAAEWNYVNRNYQYFSEINELQNRIINSDYDGELTGVYQEGDFDGSDYTLYEELYLTIIIDVLKKLKVSYFKTPPFEQDMLLGLQYGDPSIEERKLLIKVSEEINSPEWHSKMLEAYKKWL